MVKAQEKKAALDKNLLMAVIFVQKYVDALKLGETIYAYFKANR